MTAGRLLTSGASLKPPFTAPEVAVTVTPIEVHPDELRTGAALLAGTGHRVTATVPQSPPLVVTAPGWAAEAALAGAERAADTLFGAIGADIAATATRLREAAAGYEAADQRSVHRLTGGR